jgi:hypothetical protein
VIRRLSDGWRPSRERDDLFVVGRAARDQETLWRRHNPLMRREFSVAFCSLFEEEIVTRCLDPMFFRAESMQILESRQRKRFRGHDRGQSRHPISVMSGDRGVAS